VTTGAETEQDRGKRHRQRTLFDLVISSAAFHWIDPEVAFGKSARLLRPGGWLALRLR
jgi:SAM-dependent methyltransferase